MAECNYPKRVERWDVFEASCRGGYAGHGETFTHPEDILWWSHGGELHGESPERLAFLGRVLQETPGHGLAPIEASWDEIGAATEQTGDALGYFIYYYSFMHPSFRDFYFDDAKDYQAEVIDTWEMSIENRGIFRGKFRIPLPGKEYMAIRIRGIGRR